VQLTRKNIAFRDILIRDRNHPSIILWEGNNTGVGRENTLAWRSLVHQWDWIAPRPYADRRPTQCDLMDVAMESNNEDFYCAGMPKVDSEFYRQEPPRRYWDEDSPPGAYPNQGEEPYGRTQRSAMRELAVQWESVQSRGGGVKWHFSDASTHGRLPKEVCRCSGVVDGSHVPKDIYYATRAIWHSDPQVHIMGHWNYSEKHTVDVYTNCQQVEVYVNGVSKSAKNPASTGLCQWVDLQFQAGTLKAVGRIGGVERCSDERRTAGSAYQIRLTAITNPGGMKADRADVALIDATIVDANGIRCPTASTPITFSVTGQGRYRGGYNSHVQGTPGKATLEAEAGLIRVGVRATNVPGTFTVTAESNGLKGGTVTVTTHAPENHTGIHQVRPDERHSCAPGNSGIGNLSARKCGKILYVIFHSERELPVQVSLVQLHGKTLSVYHSIKTNQGMNAIPIPGSDDPRLSGGCYIVRIRLSDGQEAVARFVAVPR
jgi:beta-galactosidase